MIARIGISLGKWLHIHHAIHESQIDSIRYAFEIICSEFFELMIMIVYSLVTNQIVETILFIGTFQLLRRTYEGYHAKTITKCLMITVSVFLVILSTYASLQVNLCCFTLAIILLVQLMLGIKDRWKNPFYISFTLMCLSVLILILGYKGFLQILTLVEVVVLISYLPVRRQKR